MKPILTEKMTRRKSRREQKGSIAVEFALLISLLTTTMVAIVDLGALWRVDTLIHEAARQGVRVAVKTPSLVLNDSSVQSVVDLTLQNSGLSAGTYTSSVQFSGGTISAGDPVTVQVEYLFTPPLSGSWIPGFGPSVLLSKSVVMRYEMAG